MHRILQRLRWVSMHVRSSRGIGWFILQYKKLGNWFGDKSVPAAAERNTSADSPDTPGPVS